MKRCFCYIMILILTSAILTSFTSCTENKNNTDSQKLKYYITSQDKGDYFYLIIKGYNQYCQQNLDESYQIKFVEFASEDDMYTKMSTEIMAGGGPDIFSVDQKLPFEKLIENDALADIDKLIKLNDYNLSFDNCNSTIMDSGIYNGKRCFIPMFYCPNLFITTQETLDKYNLNASDFNYKELSVQLSEERKKYSLFGNNKCSRNFFYSFINKYVDFNNKTTSFKTDEFSEMFEHISSLVNNDSTDERKYYNFEALEKGGCILQTVESILGGSASFISRTYCYLYDQEQTPVILPNYNKDEDNASAYTECGIAINKNSKNSEKALAFIKYVLSDDVQGYWCGARVNDTMYAGTPSVSLPVNNNVFNNAITNALEDIYDFDGNNKYDEEEEKRSREIKTKCFDDYLSVINNIKECSIYNYENLENTHYNSSVIGGIVDNYLNKKISKEKFIRQLTSATEIYLKE